MLHRTLKQYLSSVAIVALTTAVLIAASLFGTAIAHAQSSSCTNYYTSSIAVPTGYGAAYNLFSSARELLVSVQNCSGASPTLTVGSNQSNQYVYKLGYVYQSSAWQPVNLTGINLVSTAWYTGTASSNLSGTPSSSWTYAVGYVCQWSGTAWQCGCHDTACSTGMWQLQAYETSAPASSGTTVTPGSGSVTDGQGNVWTVTTGNQIAKNGTVDPITTGVVLLLYYNGTIYQQAISVWYQWTGSNWASIAGDPRTGVAGGGGGGGGSAAGTRNYLIGFFQQDQNPAIHTWLGAPPDFTTGNGGMGPSGLGSSPSSNNGYPTVIGIAHYDPINEPSFDDPAAAAAGSYNSAYQSAATNAVGPYKVLAARIDFEWNGSWNTYSPYSSELGFSYANPGVSAATWVAGWRQMAKILKNNPSTANVKLAWDYPININGAGGTNDLAYYPGDDVVDIISTDVYFANQANSGLTSAQNWARYLSGTSGNLGAPATNLTTMAAFAAAHNKPMAFVEIGDGYNDGYDISQFGAWINSHNVVGFSYTENTVGGVGYLTDGGSAATNAFRAAFGNRTYTGTFFNYIPLPANKPSGY